MQATRLTLRVRIVPEQTLLRASLAFTRILRVFRPSLYTRHVAPPAHDSSSHSAVFLYCLSAATVLVHTQASLAQDHTPSLPDCVRAVQHGRFEPDGHTSFILRFDPPSNCGAVATRDRRDAAFTDEACQAAEPSSELLLTPESNSIYAVHGEGPSRTCKLAFRVRVPGNRRTPLRSWIQSSDGRGTKWLRLSSALSIRTHMGLSDNQPLLTELVLAADTGHIWLEAVRGGRIVRHRIAAIRDTGEVSFRLPSEVAQRSRSSRMTTQELVQSLQRMRLCLSNSYFDPPMSSGACVALADVMSVSAIPTHHLVSIRRSTRNREPRQPPLRSEASSQYVNVGSSLELGEGLAVCSHAGCTTRGQIAATGPHEVRFSDTYLELTVVRFNAIDPSRDWSLTNSRSTLSLTQNAPNWAGNELLETQWPVPRVADGTHLPRGFLGIIPAGTAPCPARGNTDRSLALVSRDSLGTLRCHAAADLPDPKRALASSCFGRLCVEALRSPLLVSLVHRRPYVGALFRLAGMTLELSSSIRLAGGLSTTAQLGLLDGTPGIGLGFDVLLEFGPRRASRLFQLGWARFVLGSGAQEVKSRHFVIGMDLSELRSDE